MKRTFTFLFAALLSFIGMWAQVLADGVYTIQADENGKRGYLAASVDAEQNRPVLTEISWSNYAGNSAEAMENSKNWYLTTKDGVSYLYNVAKGAFIVDGGVDEISFGENPFGLNVTGYNNYIHVGSGTGVRYLSMGCGTTAPNQVKWEKISAGDGGCLLTFTLVAGGTTTFATQIAAAEAVIAEYNSRVNSVADLSNSKVYTVSTKDRGSWYYSPEKKALSSTNKENIAVDATDLKQQYAFLTVNDKVYLYSMGANKFVIKKDGYTAVVDYPEAYVTLEASGNANFPVVVALNGTNHMGISNGYNPAVITHYNNLGDAGNQVKIVAVEGTFNGAEALAKINMGLAAERNALLAVVEEANATYDAIEDKTKETAVALKTLIDATITHANATDATAETLNAQKTALGVARANYFLGEYDLSVQTFNLKNASTGLYLTIVEAEGTNRDAGGVQIKALEEKNKKQMFQLVAVGGKYKVKSLEGFYLSAFSGWGYKATGTDNNDAVHEIAYVGNGRYTLKSTLGYVGSNSDATSDSSHMYSNHGDNNPNIYWTLEPVIPELTYTLTDVLGNTYTGTYEGVVGETLPTLSGVTGYTLSNEAWNGTAYTANIAFPFPISNAETTNATMISNFNAGQRWHAVGDDVKVQTAQPTNATKGEWLWAIYPKFENGAFTFTVKNVGNGKFVTLNSDKSSFNTQGTVTLTENGTALEVITWLGAPCFKVPGKTLYLSINGSADKDVYLATYIGGNNNHGGNKLYFTEFVDVTGVTLDKETATLTAAGATVELVATVAPDNALDKTVVWSTSNAEVATVDEDGVVTAVANGTATITAKAGEFSATCEVTVAVAVTGVTLDKETATLTAAGATVELVATVAPDNALDKTVVWSTSNAEVATVDENGVVTAVANGTATITAKAGEFSATCEVTVAVAVTGVTLDKETATLTAAGATVELVATVAPDNALDKTVVWSTSNAEVATVDENGVVTAVANGTATITAKAGEFSATCEVTVAVAVTGVTLDKETATLTAAGATVELVATVAPETAADKTVTWSTSNAEVATVDANGVVTAVANGTATITATAGEFSATCEVTVAVAVTGVTLDKETATLTAAGATVELVATVAPETAADKTVTWSTSDESVATVDANGVVTAVANGTATITATAGGFSATCEVTVAIAVTEVKLDKSEATLTAKDATLALNVTVLPEDALDKTVTWSTSNAEVATVDENGVVTAVANGTATITATAGGFSATCEVTVAIAVTEVKLDKSEATLTAKDATLALNVTVLPEDALDKIVTWSTSNAEVATVDANGVVTAVANGTATITATAGGFSATCEVTVAIAVTEVKLDKSEATLTAKDATLALNVTVLPEDALDKTVTWTSSDEAVATVDANGVVTAVANGTATITAKAGEFSATCEVTVAIAVTEVKLDKSEATLTAKDATLALNVTVLPEDALDKTVTWTSSDEAVATVDANGVVTAVANGTATITAKAGEFSATCEVTVAIAVTEVKLDKSEATLTAKDATLALNVTVLPEDALDKTVTWTSSDEAVATVDANGVVTAVANGSATITATAGGFSATCEVTVAIAVTEVKLDKSEATLTAKDATLELNVTVLPEYALDKTVTWTSSDESVAIVDANGVVTAVANGTATITATAGGFSATCEVTVAVAVTEVKLDKSEATLTAKDATLELNVTVLPEDALDKTVTWSTSNAEVATVDANGVVTAVANGTATITATAGGFSATCEVTVAIKVEMITLNTTWSELTGLGATLQLIATVAPENAVDKTITWSSSTEAVTVDETGLVTVVAPYDGTVTITATAVNGVTATCMLTVTAMQVTLDKTEAELTAWGATVELVATVAPEDAWDTSVTWTSSDETIATVDANGVVTALANGVVTITATAFDGAKAECVVTVKDIPDGIENVDNDADTVIYDLSGRRVTEMTEGIYIVNGKKVVIK